MKIRTGFSLLLALSLTGCSGYGPWAKQVGGFSTSAPPALTQVISAYTAANAAHTLEEEAVLADQYAAQGYHPGEVVDFIDPQTLAVRQAAIQVLTSYAQLVGDLALGKRMQDEIAKTKTLKQSMTVAKTTTTSASSSSAKKSPSSSLTAQQMSYVLAGVDDVMKPFIEAKVKKNLPQYLTKADPFVQKLCTLLIADLEDLRVQETSDYQTMLIEQDQFIQKNGSAMSAVEKRAEIIKLVEIEKNCTQADFSLVQAEKALSEVARAHHEIAGGKK